MRYAYTPETCPSKHYNPGNDICEDCGEDLQAGSSRLWANAKLTPDQDAIHLTSSNGAILGVLKVGTKLLDRRKLMQAVADALEKYDPDSMPG